jgi:superfamily II DNA or RNA helicase
MDLRFDHGTLLLEGARQEHATAVPSATWDPRVNALRAPAYRHAQLDAEVRRLDDTASDRVQPAAPPPCPWKPVELRPYQQAALSTWEMCGRRGLVVLPTGSGKTRLALAAMATSGLRSLVLVPTRALVDQWVRCLSAAHDGPVGVHGDGERSVQPVTVATYESAFRHAATLGNRFELLVVDEVHHFGHGVRDEALEMSTARARLGLTATPPTASGHAARLADLVGPVVYELAVRDLAGPFLAPLQLVVLTLDLTPHERVAYDAEMATFRHAAADLRAVTPEASWADLARALSQTEDGRQALAAWQRARRLLALTRAKSAVLGRILERHRDARTLVFTMDNPSAYAVAREHRVMPITCDIGRAERAEALDRFRRGDLRALVSARVLNEGLDVPDADVAVIVGGAHGEREHVQRVGRLLRPGQGKRALAYELVTRGTSEVWAGRRRRRALGA